MHVTLLAPHTLPAPHTNTGYSPPIPRPVPHHPGTPPLAPSPRRGLGSTKLDLWVKGQQFWLTIAQTYSLKHLITSLPAICDDLSNLIHIDILLEVRAPERLCNCVSGRPAG